MTATPSDGPIRTCVGCRRARPAADLVRIARRPDGSLAVARTLPGRGAWLCFGSPDCLELAARRGGFARAFRTAVSPQAISALVVEPGPSDNHPPCGFVPGRPPARD